MVLLPIGSVVQLKEAEKKLMIIGILQQNGDGKNYDFMGCPYPEGVLNSESMYLFNHSDIKDVCFLGFDNVERQMFVKNLEKELSKLG